MEEVIDMEETNENKACNTDACPITFDFDDYDKYPLECDPPDNMKRDGFSCFGVWL